MSNIRILFLTILLFNGILTCTVDNNIANNTGSNIAQKNEGFLIQDSTLSPLDEQLSNKIKKSLQKADIKDKNIIISRFDNFDINKYNGDKVTYSREPAQLSLAQKTGSPAVVILMPNFDTFKGFQLYYLFDSSRIIFSSSKNRE